MALVQRIGLSNANQRPGSQAIVDGSNRNELPHSFGDAISGWRATTIDIEIALLESQIKELWRHVVRQQGGDDLGRVGMLLRTCKRTRQTIRRAPFVDVIAHFRDKSWRYADFTLAEDTSQPKDEALVLTHLVAVNPQLIDETVVAFFQAFALVAIFGNFGLGLGVAGSRHGLFQVRQGKLQILHLIETLARQ